MIGFFLSVISQCATWGAEGGLEENLKNQLQTQLAHSGEELETAGQQAIATFEQQGQNAIAAGDEQIGQLNNTV